MPGGEITPRKRRAITALLTERDAKSAAAAAGVGYRSLLRWMQDPDFRAALTTAEGEALDATVRALIGLQGAALDVFLWAMDDETNAPGVRLRAAIAVIELLVKMREAQELEDIDRRLSELEAQGGKVQNYSRSIAQIGGA